MAKARAITKRRKAVQNIKKITQTMQLIATARFQKCLQRATATKPYTQRITEMVQTVVSTDAVRDMLKRAEQQDSDAADAGTGAATTGATPSDSDRGGQVVKLLRPNTGVTKSVLLVITSNRGLCGGYNANVLKAAMEHRRKLAAEGVTPALEMVGKKGVNYFRFLNEPMADKITDVEDKIEYARVAAMAERFIDLYQKKQVNRVEIAYMRFQSVGVQRPTVAKLLPIDPPEAKDGGGEVSTDIEFSPAPELLLARLIPETIKIRLLQYFNDAIVSEQVARMVAMKAATDAAGDMIKFLTRQYNRSRQSQITMELLDIIGGAEAIK